jgi:RNA polymerase sigma-54 factor
MYFSLYSIFFRRLLPTKLLKIYKFGSYCSALLEILLILQYMKEGFELSQTQSQIQTLAPLQVQFVKLLEMNTAAIEDEVHRRLDENPALEEVSPAAVSTDNEGDSDDYTETSEELQRADYRDEDDMMPAYRTRLQNNSDDDDRRMSIDANAASTDMSDNLVEQLSEFDLSPRDRLFAEYLIGNLDSNGRMTRTLSAIADDIAIHTGHDISRDDLIPAFNVVRSLDPAGVGAVDLRDCLLLQLRRRDNSIPVKTAIEILDRHFDLFANKHFDRLRTKIGINDEQLSDALNVIKTLNPKPGNSDSNAPEDRMMHINPDFVVEPDDNDPTEQRFNISLTQHLPELAVAQSYKLGDISAAAARRDKTLAFIKSRSQEASEFIDLLQRRSQTLLDVMTAIVEIQSEFFRTEERSSIRPMILKDIAALTGRDMSVISRATNGKYVATRGGLYPLKMFFNERPKEDSDVSSHQILEALRSMIDNEDKRHPLSDDALTDMLNERGFDIARRTVAKYREQLNLPNSRGRRDIGKSSKA